jgi:hypothetical protein
MRGNLLLIAVAVTLFGCENATAPEQDSSSADASVSLASAKATPISGQSVVREIKLKSEGWMVPLGWCDEAAGVLHAAVPGEGTMTHLGRFDIQQSGCIDFATGAVTEGMGVLTAANGDEVHLEYAGSATSAAPPTYALHYVVTGGTGRFSGAEGEADFVVIYTSETTWIAEGGGWLSYAASNRASR